MPCSTWRMMMMSMTCDSEREILSGVAREWQRMVCRLHLMIAVFLHVCMVCCTPDPPAGASTSPPERVYRKN